MTYASAQDAIEKKLMNRSEEVEGPAFWPESWRGVGAGISLEGKLL